MKRINIFLLIIAGFLFIASCDKIEPPFKEENGGGGTPADSVVKKVLLEDYTGHKCPNCAGAAITSHDLQNAYPGRIIVLAVHAGDFAKPVPGSLFDADYRTEAGNIWNDFFGVQAYPSGMVDRKEYNGDLVLTESKWGEAVANALQSPADAEIKIVNEVNNDESVVNINITVKFIHEMPDSYSLQVCMVEDSIISAQYNSDENVGPTPVIQDFVFMHMMRGAVNGAWGEDIFGGTIEPGKEYSVSYSYDIPGVAKNSRIVAFVYDKSDNSVVQVEEESVLKE